MKAVCIFLKCGTQCRLCDKKNLFPSHSKHIDSLLQIATDNAVSVNERSSQNEYESKSFLQKSLNFY